MMNIKDIVNNSMDKLHKKLLGLNEDAINNSDIDSEHLQSTSYNIKKKI